MGSSIGDRISQMGVKASGSGGGGARKAVLGVGILVGAVWLASSMVTYVEPGHVGIIIRRTSGGVDPVALGPGLHMRNPLTTGIKEYPTFMQTLVLTKEMTEGSTNNDEINVNSVEGQPISLDVSMSFELLQAKVPFLYSTFRTDIDAIQRGYLRQTIRQALQEVAGQEEIANILGPKKAEVVARTQAKLSKALEQYGIEVKQFSINEIRAPQAVMAAINAKNVMQQQALTAQNELQKNTYQAQGDSIKAVGRAKAILAEAQAQAQANELLAKSISGSLVQYEMAKKWNGVMPQVSGQAIPMIQMPSPGKP
jgi:regulator of protease activity HflC (stomatin/prohibitin superfamily)